MDATNPNNLQHKIDSSPPHRLHSVNLVLPTQPTSRSLPLLHLGFNSTTSKFCNLRMVCCHPVCICLRGGGVEGGGPARLEDGADERGSRAAGGGLHGARWGTGRTRGRTGRAGRLHGVGMHGAGVREEGPPAGGGVVGRARRAADRANGAEAGWLTKMSTGRRGYRTVRADKGKVAGLSMCPLAEARQRAGRSHGAGSHGAGGQGGSAGGRGCRTVRLRAKLS